MTDLDPAPDPVLRGAALTLGYPGASDPVVREAEVALTPGRVTALVGPNGSGKSTLLRALARLHPVDAGRVELADGSSALALSARDFARQVTLLSQTRPSPSGLAVRDVVAFGRHPWRRRFAGVDDADRTAIARAMAVTGTTEMRDRPVDELSGGELQRVWLACCLAQDTPVLLLDEPTNHLDLRYQVEVLDLVRDLADQHGTAVGVVLHDLDQAAAVADDVVLLHRGRVRAAGAPVDVLTGPLLSEVYGLRIEAVVDPGTGLVRCEPRGRHHERHARRAVPAT
ncbi:ABC transporter ATP-binding protein [Nocardioides perillae]|uniref:Iron complex transport system ATP-binding protein n=1 Tax=Nocardioides perillae TaxID=1119534 RepID=A0A7Y9RXU9_9ACTN|nr:ABC transporter ATP-binding protein [Nocardioides perillae]NYG56717.1 iron complex transport system ATP-binding protein [Nocardioides perillae]